MANEKKNRRRYSAATHEPLINKYLRLKKCQSEREGERGKKTNKLLELLSDLFESCHLLLL